ncbi:hypothetical protein MIV099R [Invertebrate iridescent virus 3]|uniref:Uncharacterized protein 099R n=1 Tax=Invertebrate iridescent virus 3 TaxID=345201 RepID=VF329_IIV3|nr:hypothetical protein MIV099R [Invertebrate iridescent virus 3]Q196W1.1 RecName: Full=Uncharacterized protein 099R [Invertebrate iridescent virus 3]ABF82129.1 hypothetical protein MIV099R [Invertebrate iridescent virus 3]
MISYSALTTHGKSTLPSIEGWNGNHNIVKNPPSAVHTRRIIKVGTDNCLLEATHESGGRSDQVIRQFARGVNPMVSVQYSNHGTGGNGSLTTPNDYSIFTTGGHGKLPNRIMKGGAFRPPIIKKEDLLPLSRLPREQTSVFSTKCSIDQTKKITPDVVEYFKHIHQNPIHSSASSQFTFSRDSPHHVPKNIHLMVNPNGGTVGSAQSTKVWNQKGSLGQPKITESTVATDVLTVSTNAPHSYHKQQTHPIPSNIDLLVQKDLLTTSANAPHSYHKQQTHSIPFNIDLMVNSDPIRTSADAPHSYRKQQTHPVPKNIHLMVNENHPPVLNVHTNARASKDDTGEARVWPRMESPLTVAGMDYLYPLKISQQKWHHGDNPIQLVNKVPHCEVNSGGGAAMGGRPRYSQMHQMEDQKMVLSKPRPERNHSKSQIENVGTVVKLNQERIFSGAKVLNRKIQVNSNH